ncbi:[phosphatase 2A protein]-leucine-carboxy methyltransferase [Malassezia psittaci]|uniref:Spindle assembly checkpoint component MAD1 n=1 Tax=Malassezia psittaci TaxID=1821823 RepID=A0AAF0FII3_9BASI|nr:[phosphatase 2A protein]-leucine-carboxy methyltransferase [Malassezia psittaci]
MSDELPSISTPQGRPLGSRRNGASSIPLSTSSLPMPSRRTPQSVRRTPSASRTVQSSGPLGTYRNLARSGSTPLRPSSTAESESLGKRTYSASGLADTPVSARAKIPAYLDRSNSAMSKSTPPSESYELAMLRSEYERRSEEDQRAYKSLESQLKTQSRELEALKCQRVEVLKEWESERESQRQKEDSWLNSKREWEEQVAQARSESLQSQDTIHQLRSELRKLQDTSHQRESEFQSDLIKLQSEKDHQQSDAEHWKQIAEKLREKNQELNATQTRAPITPNETDLEMLKEQLSQNLSKVQQLESQQHRLTAVNRRMADACERMEILRETNRSLEAKVERMQQYQTEALQLEQQLQALQAEQEEWRLLLQKGIETDQRAAFVAAANAEQSSTEIQTPSPLTMHNLPTYISSLRGCIMGLSARIQGLNHSLEELRSSNLQLENRSRQGSENETNLAKELKESTANIHRVQRQNEVLQDEIQRYKELVASFETEAQNDQHNVFDQIQAQRVADLESQLHHMLEDKEKLMSKIQDAEQRAIHAEQQTELLRTTQVETHPSDSAGFNETRAALESLQTEYAQLEAQLQQVTQENDQLYLRVGRGEFNSSREKCLVLQDNPVSRDYAIRTSTLEALRKENAQLLERIESLHQHHEATGTSAPASEPNSAVPIQTVENLKQKISQLEDAIQLKDKGMLRLKQVFTAKANEFREAVQSLFGYKLRFLENGKVKLTSAYARGARVTTLVFSSEEGDIGAMKLQGEAMDGLANVAHLRDYWLSDGIRHSVPCFLAALNLELYENTTQAIRGTFGTDVEDS